MGEPAIGSLRVFLRLFRKLILFKKLLDLFQLKQLGSILWPIPLIMGGFFWGYPLLKPMVGNLTADLIVSAIPTVTLTISVILHWKGIIKALCLMVAILASATIGTYNVWLIMQNISISFPRQIGFELIQLLATQNWLLLIFYSAPAIVSVLAARYLWSHPSIRKKLKTSAKEPDTFGAAQLADIKTIQRLNHPEGIPIGALPKVIKVREPQKIVQAIKEGGGEAIIRLKADHATIIAPSRTGKGVGVVIPTLLEYPGPVFVTDIKGENYAVTGRARKNKNKMVIAFDPFEITRSPKMRLNPLDFLDPTSKTIVDDCHTLANLICPTHAQDGTNASYFQSQGAAVIQCLLLYVTCSKDIDKKEKNLAKVYDLLCLPETELLELLTEIGKNKSLGYGTAANLANRITSTDSRERSGILNSACVEMRFVDTPYVRGSTCTSDVCLKDITLGNMDLFVCIPPEKLANQSRLLRLFTGIVFLEMQRARGNIGAHNLLMLIDETPALGHMEQIDQILMYGGGYGISLIVIAQTIELMRGVYPKSWETFLSNQLSLFFGCTDLKTCEFVSKMLGTKTVDVNSSNDGKGTQIKAMEWLGSSSKQSGTSVSETGRALLMPNEIKELGNRVVLAFLRGESPIMCQRIDYREREEWEGAYDENPLHENRKKTSN